MAENLDIQVNERGAREVQRNIAGIGTAARQASGPVRELQRLLAAYVSLQGLRSLAKIADQYTEMENRLRVLDNISGHYTNTMSRLLSISNETRSSLRDNVLLFQRMGLAQKELNASTNELFQVTRAVGQAIAIQGGLATTSAGAVLQLSQAFGSGRVQLEEFNSVITGLYPIAKAAAEGIDAAGGSIAKLRRLIADGEIDSRTLFQGILKSVSSLDDQFGKTVPTVSQSMTVLNNVFTVFIGELNKSLNASVTFSQAVLSLAHNFDTVVNSAVVLAFTFGPALLLGAVTKIGAALAALTIANPFLAAVSAVSGLTAYLVLFNSDLDDLTKKVDAGATAIDRLAATAIAALAYVKTAWETFPEWFGGLFTKAVDKAVEALSRIGSATADSAFEDAAMGKKILDFFGLTPEYANKALSEQEQFRKQMTEALDFDLPQGVLDRQAENGSKAATAFQDAYTKYLTDARTRRESLGSGDPDSRPNGALGSETDEKAIRKLNRELDRLMRQIDPAESAWRELIKAQDVLTRAWGAGMITLDEFNQYMGAAQRQFEKTIFPVQEFIRENERLINLLGKESEERERLEAINDLELDMRRKLTDAELKQVDATLKRLQLARTESNLLQSIAGPREEYYRSTDALINLLAKGDITQGEYSRAKYEAELAYLQAYPSVANSYKASLIQVQEEQRQLNEAINDNVISLDQFNARMTGTTIQLASLKTTIGEADVGDVFTASLDKLYNNFQGTAESLKDMLSDLWGSLGDGVANSIGRAIVYAEDLGSAVTDVARSAISQLIGSLVKLGMQWVIMNTLGTGLALSSTVASASMATATAAAWAPAAALASLATLGTNSVPANAALIETVGLANALAMFGGYQDGGWTGNGSTGEVAGFVHGREFVTNAQATAKYRPVLEAMNDGEDIGGFGGGFYGNVIFINETGVPMAEPEVRYTTEGDVEVIARRVVNEQAGNAVARDMRDPTSAVRKSMAKHTTTQPRRG